MEPDNLNSFFEDYPVLFVVERDLDWSSEFFTYQDPGFGKIDVSEDSQYQEYIEYVLDSTTAEILTTFKEIEVLTDSTCRVLLQFFIDDDTSISIDTSSNYEIRSQQLVIQSWPDVDFELTEDGIKGPCFEGFFYTYYSQFHERRWVSPIDVTPCAHDSQMAFLDSIVVRAFDPIVQGDTLAVLEAVTMYTRM